MISTLHSGKSGDKCVTRLHYSRMRIARALTVSRSMLARGGVLSLGGGT